MYKLPSLIFFSIRTEMDRDGLGGATSHMAIAQASLAHSGIYTCSVSDSISQSLRLHIIDGERVRRMLNCQSKMWRILFLQLLLTLLACNIPMTLE